MKETNTTASPQITITPEALLEHWQGHRRLTRRAIEAFPEDKLFTYSVGGMRPFADLAIEMIGMAAPTLRGIVSGKWEGMEDIAIYKKENKPATKAELLRYWDEGTAELNELWPKIAPGRFLETDLAFGQWEGPVYWILFYCIDNEIHHRGQGYVYLRSLGIEPPPFWER